MPDKAPSKHRLQLLARRIEQALLAAERRLTRTHPLLVLGGAAAIGALARLAGATALTAWLLAALLAYSYVLLLLSRTRTITVAREMNAALSRSETRVHAMIDTAPDAVIGVDAKGAVCQCNRATTNIFGRADSDLIGQPLALIVPSFTLESFDEWFANHAIARRVIGFETVGVRVDGTPFPIAVSASETELDGERFYTFILRDLSDSKWAEEQLLLRERALASSADGIVISDMRHPNAPVIYANRAFELMTGYEIAEILGQNCGRLQGPDTDAAAVARLSGAIRERRPCQEVLRNYRKDGTPFWNQVAIAPVEQPDGQVTHYVGVLKDVTQRIASEEMLQQRTERLNVVFDLSPDGFIVLDEHDVVRIVNPVVERVTGMRATDLVGLRRDQLEEALSRICSGRELVTTLPMAGDAQAEGEPAPDDGAPAQHELLHVQTPAPRTLLRRIRHSSGGTHETVMYLRDITHELEVDRMKSEFLSMAAHELRTPMVSVFGFTELLLKRRYDDERRQDMLATVHKQAGRLITLVNELLDLARIEARRGTDFLRRRQALQPVVRESVAALLVDQNQQGVILVLPDDVVWVDVDEKKMAQALTNVLSNAYKYSPAGGEIRLTMQRDERSGRPGCSVAVTDHGMGMSAEQVARVFERFFRADTSGNIPGTGLGMTIVKEIVELHGGEVAVASAPGEGTTVTMWLPTVDGPLAAAPRGEEVSAA